MYRKASTIVWLALGQSITLPSATVQQILSSAYVASPLLLHHEYCSCLHQTWSNYDKVAHYIIVRQTYASKRPVDIFEGYDDFMLLKTSVNAFGY